MTTKHVIYLAGLETAPEQFDEKQAIADLGLPADTCFTSSNAAFPDMEKTVEKLLLEGAHEVFAIHATLDEAGRVKPFGEPMRVIGAPEAG